jgi:hypothetical protein
MHERIFTHFSLGLSSASAWLAPEPPVQLVAFLQQFQSYGRISLPLTYKLGKDVDYVIPRIDALLAHQFEDSLRRSFPEADSTIPFDILAQSIAATYSWLIRAWFTERRTLTAGQLATYMHKLTRAAIYAAFEGK